MTFDEYIGKVIREARMKKGMSQRELAEKVGLTRGQYSHYETGKNSMSLESWTKIARILELEPDKVPLQALKEARKKPGG